MSFIFAQNTDTIWQEGVYDFAIQNYHGVIKNMNRLIEVEPAHAAAYYNRGLAKINLGDIDDACNDFHDAAILGFEKNKLLARYYCDPSYKLNFLKKYYYKKETLLPENNNRPRYTRADTLRGALRPERTCFDVYYYELTVRIIPQGKKIRGTNDIYLTVMEPSRTIQIDLFDNYTINEIMWQDRKLDFVREYNAVFIKFPVMINPGEKHVIRITYYGKPAKAQDPPWKGGFVWKRDKKFNRWAGVACEHYGASSWWPTKDHLSDKPDSMKINIEVPGRYDAISNGTLRNTEKVDKSYKRYEWFVSYPINNYNVTFYMGRYTRFYDTLIMANDTLLLKYYVMPYNLEKAKKHFTQTSGVLKFYTNVFGKYPFARDGYGLVESPYSGMEHQTAIAYGNEYSNEKEFPYRNRQYDYIIVHESAHEWWGNSVTAGDMADAWIHEGFATYAEMLFIENVFGNEEYLYEINNKAGNIYNVWPMVQNRNVNEDSFAGSDIYNKGAMMLHCFRCTLNNDSLFFRVIKDFCVSNRYRIVSTDDFIEFVNLNTKGNYSAFFNKYLYDTRLPVLEYSFRKDSSDMFLSYKWTEVEDGFTMPFCIETDCKKSIRLTGTTDRKEIKLENTSWFIFFNIWKGYEGAEQNSFTYFWTRCLSY